MNLNYVNYIFTAFAVVMCAVLAYFLMFTDMFNKMSATQRQVLTAVLVLYAAFRTFRLVKSIQQEKSNRDDV